MNNIVLFFLLFFAQKKNFYLLVLSIVSVAVILYFLPDTAPDYLGYKLDYESGHQIDAYPYFQTAGRIDSEPYYRIYSAFIRVVTGLSFPGYLALNFILGYSLLYLGLKRIFKPNVVTIFMFLGLLSIVPTVFYYLPRSALSYVLTVLAFVFYVKKRPLFALGFSFLTLGLHSQYIVALFVLLLSYFWYELFIKDKQSKVRIYIYIGVMILLLLVVFKWTKEVLSLLAFLPTDTSFLEAKAGYLEGGNQGMRLTSILSVFVFPLMFIYLYKKEKFLEVFREDQSKETYNRFVFLLGASVLLAFILNLVFINIPHVSGRLSRFSDYTMLMIGVGTFLLSIKNSEKLLPLMLLLLAFVVPFLYPAVYDFQYFILDIW